MLTGSVFLLLTQFSLNKKVKSQKEALEPAKIELIILTAADCEICFDVGLVENALETENVELIEKNEISYLSDDGKNLIEKYQITKVPTVIFKGELGKESFQEFLNNYTQTIDDASVLTAINPPFIDLKTGEIMGKVSITFLTDSNCSSCYDVKFHKEILSSQYGVFFENEKTVEANSKEGQALIAKYDIEYIPTVILSPEAVVYSSVLNIWESVGTMEPDNNFVFRKLDSISGSYKEVATGKIIDTSQQE